MIRPVTAGCQYGDTFIRLSALEIKPNTNAPMMVLTMLPCPPERGVPPTTTAAMALSSYPEAACGCPVFVCPSNINPPMPARIAAMVYTAVLVRSTSMPESPLHHCLQSQHLLAERRMLQHNAYTQQQLQWMYDRKRTDAKSDSHIKEGHKWAWR